MLGRASANRPTVAPWLQGSAPSTADSGALIQLIAETSRPADLVSTLARELVEARFPPQLLADYADVLGIRSASEILHGLAPRRPKIRRGYFGEVIAASCLRDLDGCWIPVQKLRSMITSDQSLPGIDVLGARIAEDGFKTLIFVEAKVRTTRDRRVILKATQELLVDFEKQFPSILHFTAIQLQQRADPMYRPFLAYLKRRGQLDTEDLPYVYLLLEKGIWSQDDLSFLEDIAPLPTGFRISVIEIDNLAKLVDDAYASIQILVDDSDDE